MQRGDVSADWANGTFDYGFELPSLNTTSEANYSISMSTTVPAAEYSDIFPVRTQGPNRSSSNGATSTSLNRRATPYASQKQDRDSSPQTITNTHGVYSSATSNTSAGPTPTASSHSANSPDNRHGSSLSNQSAFREERKPSALSRGITATATTNDTARTSSLLTAASKTTSQDSGARNSPRVSRGASASSPLWEPVALPRGPASFSRRSRRERTDSLHSSLRSASPVQHVHGELSSSSVGAAAKITSPTYSLGSSLVMLNSPGAASPWTEAQQRASPGTCVPSARSFPGRRTPNAVRRHHGTPANIPTMPASSSRQPSAAAAQQKTRPISSTLPQDMRNSSEGAVMGAGDRRGVPPLSPQRPMLPAETLTNTATVRRRTYPESSNDTGSAAATGSRMTSGTAAPAFTKRASAPVLETSVDSPSTMRYSIDNLVSPSTMRQVASAGAQRRPASSAVAAPLGETRLASSKHRGTVSGASDGRAPRTILPPIPATASAANSPSHSFPRAPRSGSTITTTTPKGTSTTTPLQKAPRASPPGLSPLQLVTPAMPAALAPAFAPVSILKKPNASPRKPLLAAGAASSSPRRSSPSGGPEKVPTREAHSPPSSHIHMRSQDKSGHHEGLARVGSRGSTRAAPSPAPSSSSSTIRGQHQPRHYTSSPALRDVRGGSATSSSADPTRSSSTEVKKTGTPKSDVERASQEAKLAHVAALIEKKIRESSEGQGEEGRLSPRHAATTSVESRDRVRRQSPCSSTTTTATNSRATSTTRSRFEVAQDSAPRVADMIARLNSGFSQNSNHSITPTSLARRGTDSSLHTSTTASRSVTPSPMHAPQPASVLAKGSVRPTATDSHTNGESRSAKTQQPSAASDVSDGAALSRLPNFRIAMRRSTESQPAPDDSLS